jgi:uncharacterized protein (TIGR03382 family)
MYKPEDFPLPPPGQSIWLWLWVPLLLSGLALSAGLLSGYRGSVLHMLPVFPIMALGGAGLAWMVRRRRIRLDNRELQITATLYTRKVAVEAIDLSRARVVSLEERTELKPRFKTNGFSAPGFHAGHFRLRNLTKAFCLITDRTRVLSLPLRDGGQILLSQEKPHLLLDRLRELADIPRRR